MFDLIIAYLVIMFLVNTAKSAKEQQKKGAENQKKATGGKSIGKYAPYGNKRLPQKKQEAPLPGQPTALPARTVGPTAVCVDGRPDNACPQPAVATDNNNRIKPPEQQASVTKTTVDSTEEERLQEILQPTEVNILTGLIWSDILGPPVCKRSKRY